MAKTLMILGASARAAAVSAARAGFQVVAGDLFADLDLQQVSKCLKVPTTEYPRGLPNIAEQLAPADYWLYTGGLENYPRIVAEISRQIPLAGTQPEALKQIRNPFQLGKLLAGHGIVFPETQDHPKCLPVDGSWLQKPLQSCGGIGVVTWHGNIDGKEHSNQSPHYYQRRENGIPCSAALVARAKEVRVLGATRQLLTSLPTTAHGHRFRYIGSVGPLKLAPWLYEWLHRLGRIIADGFGIAGLFGVDFLLKRKNESACVIEINPRYTASMEIIERSFGLNMIQHQLNSSLVRISNSSSVCGETGNLWWKRVLYANANCRISSQLVDWAFNQRDPESGLPLCADIPSAGTEIRAGNPLMTVFARGRSATEIRGSIRKIMSERRMPLNW